MSFKFCYIAFESELPKGDKSSVAAERAVYISLADHADSDGLCWPGYERLASRTGFSRARVAIALDWLVEQGYVMRLGVPAGKKRRSMDYRILNPENVVVPPKLLVAELNVVDIKASSRSRSIEEDLRDTSWAD